MSMNNKSIFLEGLFELDDPFTPLSENGFSEMEPSTTTKDRTKERYPPIEDNNILDDDPNNLVDDHENDDSYEYRKRAGKGHQAKNLEAERKRRKKLNDRLYSLRALVPNISKLDRGAILGDAINYIKELQTQVKDLQIELEEDSYDENSNDAMVIVRNCTDHNSMQNGPKNESGSFLIKDFYTNESFGDGGIDASRRNANETVQQMEPQVEVFQVDGNEYFVKVFNEHRHGGFVRIMEGLSSLGFQVINVNATRHTCLVSNIFTVEKSDKEIVQADHVRESLLELARNPLRTWP